MSNKQAPTLADVMNRINELESKLTQPEPLDFNAKLRAEARAARDRNTFKMRIAERTESTPVRSGNRSEQETEKE